MEGPTLAGGAEVTSAGMGLAAFCFLVERRRLTRIVTGGDGGADGDAGCFAGLVGARDRDQDLARLSDKLHPCLVLLHWKQARFPFLAQGKLCHAHLSHLSMTGSISQSEGGSKRL